MSTTNSARVFVSLFTVGFLAFTTPSTTYAAWWNPLDWFSKAETVQQPLLQRDARGTSTPAEAAEETPEADTPAPVVAQQPVVVPVVNTNQDAETITALRADVATLKASLDNLYAAHSRLVNDHNALLEYTKSIAAAQKTPATVVQQADTSAIERRVSELERKAKLVSDELYGGGIGNTESTLNSICAWVFGSSIISGCPSSNPNGIGSIDSRLEKLERGL